MPVTVGIRDLDDEVYDTLAHRAAESNVSVSELLRREITRFAERSQLRERLQRSERLPSSARTHDVLDTLDELRSSWPDDQERSDHSA